MDDLSEDEGLAPCDKEAMQTKLRSLPTLGGVLAEKDPNEFTQQQRELAAEVVKIFCEQTQRRRRKCKLR